MLTRVSDGMRACIKLDFDSLHAHYFVTHAEKL